MSILFKSFSASAEICLRQCPRQLSRRSRRFASHLSQKRDDFIRIVEVGPRDGLQNEKKSIPVATKLELIRRLAGTGIETIEAGSFVSPKWVPQMANSSEILEDILENTPASPNNITYQWLLPNVKGFENYLAVQKSRGKSASKSAAKVKHEVSIFMAATETFSKKNTNCTIAESLERFRPLMSEAKAQNTPVRAYISVALGCPYEGVDVKPGKVAELAATLLEMGSDEISVADTTGMGTKVRLIELLSALKHAGLPWESLAFHFHDTYGQAVTNTATAMEWGIKTFDSAVGGLGGCPFSPGATGNVATEDLIRFIHGSGGETGIDLEKVAEIGEWISGELGRTNESRAGRAMLAKRK